MRPSSTSSSEKTRRREWRTFFVIVLMLLASAETALRFPQVRALLPARTHYYHPAIAHRLDALDRVMLAYGRVDVLFLGSSIVLTNVHPLVFDLLAEPRRIVSFNAGLPGLWPTSVHLYAEHVWLPLTRPRVVVQGVRYPELAATTHAKNDTQVWSGRIEPSWREASGLTRAYASAVSRISLLQYYGAGTRFLQRFRDGWIGMQVSTDDDGCAMRGYSPRGKPLDMSPETWTADLPNDGTCARPRCDVGFAALRRTIAATRAAGAAYVLVNVPEHSIRWRERDALDRYRHYVESLRAFAAAERVGFIDPTDGDPFRFIEMPYHDPAHMTAAGSRQFTRELAGRIAPLLEAVLAPRRELHATRRGPLP